MGRSHANRGQALEELIIILNGRYRAQGKAVIHKVPTAWLPIRGSTGKIISAKVEEKAAVDFMGRYGVMPIAFDAKHTQEHRIRWDRVEPHQEKFLDDWTKDGKSIGFVLVGYDMRQFFVVPWVVWKSGLMGWRQGEEASIKIHSLAGTTMEVRRQDYLKVVDQIWLSEEKAG